MMRSAALASAEKLLVLSDRGRLAILWALLDGGRRQSDLERRFRMGARVLSGHLKALQQAGFITASGEGTRLLYTLALPVLSGSGGKGLDLGWCRLVIREGEAGNVRESGRIAGISP